uniref:HEAT repeat-containing protein 3 n=1 Tax=Angiostrongylus cantonensis TaxID=6313 RepID=A0A0K0DRI2_ANGCA
MLKTLVIDRLRDPSKFVRARAAWCIKQYSEARFFYTETLAKIIESLVQCLCDTNEELPVQVESALAIQCLLKHQDKVHTLVHPSMGVIILKVLELLTKTKIEDVIFVVDEFLEQYIEDVVPVSSEVAEHLCHLFLEILGSSDVDDRTPTLLSIIHTLHNILDVVEGHMEIMVKVEGSVLKVINAILEVKNFEFYDNVVLLLQSILQSYVSEPMWDVFDKMYNVFKTSDSLTVLPFSELGQVLHLYIVTDTESFLAFPHRLAAVLDMCITVIKVVIAALYVNLDVTLQAFHQIAPDHPNLLEYICDQFLSCYKKMEGIHNRRMALIGICLYFQLPPPVRPSLISTDPKKAFTHVVLVIGVSVAIAELIGKFVVLVELPLLLWLTVLARDKVEFLRSFSGIRCSVSIFFLLKSAGHLWKKLSKP